MCVCLPQQIFGVVILAGGLCLIILLDIHMKKKIIAKNFFEM